LSGAERTSFGQGDRHCRRDRLMLARSNLAAHPPDGAAHGANHPSPERWHRQVIGKAVHVHDRMVMHQIAPRTAATTA
ncbi:MAG: hypothetical protein WCE32_26815, partial [Pseudolabrys sp.]